MSDDKKKPRRLAPRGSSLSDDRVQRRNVMLNNKRTTVKLEREMWEALEEICEETNQTLDEYCSRTAKSDPDGVNFTSALRVRILRYFREKSRLCSYCGQPLTPKSDPPAAEAAS